MSISTWTWNGPWSANGPGPGYDITCEWALLTPPVNEPISILEAKRQARINHEDEDALIQSYIAAARQAAEEYLQRGLLTQTWKLTLAYWADLIWLPMAAPLQSVTSVKYYDVAGALQTLDPTVYTVDTVSRPGKICRAPNQVWLPLQTDRWSGRVEITYVAGWATPVDVPERIKQGMRMYIGYLDSDREGMDAEGENARKAAEACWTDRVFWKQPSWVSWW